MVERKSSKTALGAAVLRAVHQILDGEPKILVDPVISRLLDPAELEGIQSHPDVFQKPHSLALRSHILVRSRFTEDRLAQAVQRGVRQVLILGAGLDTFAYRQPAWAEKLVIFEVDQPASAKEKQERLKKGGINIPANLSYITIDFEKEALATALIHGGFNPEIPTFISWLGVMVYLNQAAIDAVFDFAAGLPKTSEMVFTFASERAPTESNDRAHYFKNRAADLGEPWLTFNRAEDLEPQLRQKGFSQVTFLTPQEITHLYMGGRQDGLKTFQHTNTASIIV